MIVSDSGRFVFVHNPKVGGMTIRIALKSFDTRNNRFFEWQQIGHQKVRIDMAHITPQQLRRYFPDVFDQVAPYCKFGFVRDPYARYFSALSQHLKRGTPFTRVAILGDPDLFYRFAAAFTQHLTDKTIQDDFRLVHFRRQSDFFYIGALRWADLVFKIEEPDAVAGTPVAGWLGDALKTVRNPTEAFAGTGYDPAALPPGARRAVEDYYAADFERFGYAQF